VTRDGGDAAALVSQLDGVVKQYADVLRADPGSTDAAFNYEFVVRCRAAIAAAAQAMPPAAADEGLTMHGRAAPKGHRTRGRSR
jgi:hypothetical protein